MFFCDAKRCVHRAVWPPPRSPSPPSRTCLRRGSHRAVRHPRWMVHGGHGHHTAAAALRRRNRKAPSSDRVAWRLISDSRFRPGSPSPSPSPSSSSSSKYISRRRPQWRVRSRSFGHARIERGGKRRSVHTFMNRDGQIFRS